jgi:hypothetical protein
VVACVLHTLAKNTCLFDEMPGKYPHDQAFVSFCFVLFWHLDMCGYGGTCGYGNTWVVHRLYDLPPPPTLMRAVLEVVAQAGDPS